MNKTPDEIKKGLEICTDDEKDCTGCPYEDVDACHGEMMDDAFWLIENLAAEFEAVKREHDALRDGFKMELGCSVCKYFDDDAEYVSNDCFGCGKNKCNWEYRGLCKENGGIEV